MANGNDVVITGGSLDITFDRAQFDESGNKFSHKDKAKTTLVSLSINGGTPITLNRKDVITIHYE